MTRKQGRRRSAGAFHVPRTYTLFHELAASASAPMPAEFRRYQLTRMWDGLAAIERAPAPTIDNWRVCSDCINLLETLVAPAPKGCGALEDPGGLLDDAVRALAEAGQRHQETGAPIRLSAGGIQAVRACLEDYAAAVDQLPARTMIRAHRLTESRIREILRHGSARGPRVVDL